MLALPFAAAASEPDERQETSARFDVTSDVLADPGTYVLGSGLSMTSRRDSASSIQEVTGLQFFGLYSWSQRLDVFSRLSGEYTRVQTGLGSPNGDTRSDGGFGQWLLGGRYQVIEEGRSPGLRLIVNTTVAAEHADIGYFTEVRTSLRMHRSADPVNVELALRYNYTRERDVEPTLGGGPTLESDPGDTVTLGGDAEFVVNDRVVLIGGIEWQYQQRSRVADRAIETVRFNTPFRLGLRYGITPVTNIETRIQHIAQTETTRLDLSVSKQF